MPASYPTSAKAFTSKSTSDTIQASHVNDLQDEVTAIEQDLIAGLPVGRGGTGVTTAAALRALSAVVVALTDGATPALDASLASVFTLAAAGDRTIAVPSNPTSGQKIIIRHLASGGARTLALNSGAGGFRFGSDITALTATASGKIDYIGCIYNTDESRWDAIAVAQEA